MSLWVVLRLLQKQYICIFLHMYAPRRNLKFFCRCTLIATCAYTYMHVRTCICIFKNVFAWWPHLIHLCFRVHVVLPHIYNTICAIYRMYTYKCFYNCVQRETRFRTYSLTSNNLYNARCTLNIPFANHIIRNLCCCNHMSPTEIPLFLVL